MARKQDVQAERTWLVLAGSIIVGGLAIVATADSPLLCNPFFYVGAGVSLVGSFFAVGAFWPRARLLKLPSERRAERFQHDYREWIARGSAWLRREVSQAAADQFDHPGGSTRPGSGWFNEEHQAMRRTLLWRLTQLRELARE